MLENPTILLSDCIGGTIVAYIVYWAQWTFKDQFDSLFTSQSYWGKLILKGSI
jgi:hypothetical protein